MLSQVLQTYQRAVTAQINWEKCFSFLIGDCRTQYLFYHNLGSGTGMVLRGIFRNCRTYEYMEVDYYSSCLEGGWLVTTWSEGG